MGKKIWMSVLVLSVAGCGSSGSGGSNGDDDDGSGPIVNCSSIEVGAGLVCDNATSPPTLRADLGTNPGQVAAGNDGRLSSVPTATQLAPKFLGLIGAPTTVAGVGGMAYYHAGPPALIGVQAAQAQCRSSFANDPRAHVCTSQEILRLVGANTPGLNMAAISAAVYDVGPYFGNVVATGDNTINSFKGNCQGWTSNQGGASAGATTRNTVFTTVAVDPHTLVNADELTVRFETDLPCDTTRPIACCGAN